MQYYTAMKRDLRNMNVKSSPRYTVKYRKRKDEVDQKTIDKHLWEEKYIWIYVCIYLLVYNENVPERTEEAGNINCLQGGKLGDWGTEVERTGHCIVFKKIGSCEFIIC